MNFIAGYLMIITKDEEKSFWLMDALVGRILPGKVTVNVGFLSELFFFVFVYPTANIPYPALLLHRLNQFHFRDAGFSVFVSRASGSLS